MAYVVMAYNSNGRCGHGLFGDGYVVIACVVMPYIARIYIAMAHMVMTDNLRRYLFTSSRCPASENVGKLWPI